MPLGKTFMTCEQNSDTGYWFCKNCQISNSNFNTMPKEENLEKKYFALIVKFRGEVFFKCKMAFAATS